MKEVDDKSSGTLHGMHSGSLPLGADWVSKGSGVTGMGHVLHTTFFQPHVHRSLTSRVYLFHTSQSHLPLVGVATRYRLRQSNLMASPRRGCIFAKASQDPAESVSVQSVSRMWTHVVWKGPASQPNSTPPPSYLAIFASSLKYSTSWCGHGYGHEPGPWVRENPNQPAHAYPYLSLTASSHPADKAHWLALWPTGFRHLRLSFS